MRSHPGRIHYKARLRIHQPHRCAKRYLTNVHICASHVTIVLRNCSCSRKCRDSPSSGAVGTRKVGLGRCTEGRHTILPLGPGVCGSRFDVGSGGLSRRHMVVLRRISLVCTGRRLISGRHVQMLASVGCNVGERKCDRHVRRLTLCAYLAAGAGTRPCRNPGRYASSGYDIGRSAHWTAAVAARP